MYVEWWVTKNDVKQIALSVKIVRLLASNRLCVLTCRKHRTPTLQILDGLIRRIPQLSPPRILHCGFSDTLSLAGNIIQRALWYFPGLRGRCVEASYLWVIDEEERCSSA